MPTSNIRLTLVEAVSTYENSRPVTLPDGSQSTVGEYLAGLTPEEGEQLIDWQGHAGDGVRMRAAGTDTLLVCVGWRPS